MIMKMSVCSPRHTSRDKAAAYFGIVKTYLLGVNHQYGTQQGNTAACQRQVTRFREKTPVAPFTNMV